MCFEQADAVKNNATYMDRQRASGLKQGDCVKITRIAKNFEDGWDDVWNGSMDWTVGKTGTIERPGNGFGFDVVAGYDGSGFPVKVGDEIWYYPFFVLEKVDPCP